MKFLLVFMFASLSILPPAFGQNEMEDDDMSMSEMDMDVTEAMIDVPANEIQAAYESLAPVDHDDYLYRGVNIGYQNNTTFEDTRAVMIMGPNLSYLSDEYNDAKEEMFFLKWNHGVAFNYETTAGLVQPLVAAGLGYAWYNGARDENAPMAEALLGVNFVPSNRINIYAKGGYRFLDLDDAGANSVGDLRGSTFTFGLGVSI